MNDPLCSSRGSFSVQRPSKLWASGRLANNENRAWRVLENITGGAAQDELSDAGPTIGTDGQLARLGQMAYRQVDVCLSVRH